MLEILQIYWWCVVALLAGLLVFMLFVQGGQTLLFGGFSESEKDLIVNSIGKKWELTYTTLVLFGGANFAAFPLFYATSFGGAYWAWMILLLCFVLQAVAYEYRKKPENFLGQKTYEIFLFINGSLGVFLLGVIISMLFSGAEFSLSQNRFVSWQSPFCGLEALINPLNFLLGFALIFGARVGGILYMQNNIKDEIFYAKLRQKLRLNSTLFLAFFVAFAVWILAKNGFEIAPNGEVVSVEFKYLKNFIALPLVLVEFLAGLALVLYALFVANFRTQKRTIFAYGAGEILAVMAVFLALGLNNTPFYPSSFDPQSSLSIANASSSLYTLKTMFFVSLLVPFVLGYIVYVWRAMDAGGTDKESLGEEIY